MRYDELGKLCVYCPECNELVARHESENNRADYESILEGEQMDIDKTSLLINAIMKLPRYDVDLCSSETFQGMIKDDEGSFIDYDDLMAAIKPIVQL